MEEKNVDAVPAPKKKRIDGDSEADRLLELQLSLKDKSKVSNWLCSILAMAFIFIFAILFWVVPDREYTSEESGLKMFPEFTRETFLSGEFTSEFGEYMADQFPARKFFVGLKAVSETAQLKQVNNDTFIIGDFLVARNDYPNEDFLNINVSSAAKFENAAEKKGIDVVAAFAGRKMDVYDNKLPSYYGSYYSDRIWNKLDEIAAGGELSYLNLRNTLREAAKNDDGLYYDSDHHWTSHGAYLAYVEIITELGGTPYAEDDFRIETVTDDFYGTTWSAAGAKWTKGDTIEYYRFDGDEDYTMKIIDKSGEFEGLEGFTHIEEDGAKYAVCNGFYVEKFLNEKDKYASFIGGNHGITKITKNTDEERETLLVVKDSFAHSLVPFLARHYDLVLVDLRYYPASMLRYAETNDIDKVLLMYNMETLTEAAYLKSLQIGAK
ncbi:MAG: hypothetical protein IJ389_06360 [Clostridia bacterium]|nr:hypothetical protein [Clostridia bacterium]